ncbi:autotransporter outer membrane beta-barrel domain-containing protein [Bartonella sp. B41]
MIKVLKHQICLCALTTSVFFFVPNVGVKAEDDLKKRDFSCSSPSRSYECGFVYDGTLGSDYEVKITKSKKKIIKEESADFTIKPQKDISSYIGETLQLKKFGMIVAPEVLASKDKVVIVNNFSITGNGNNADKSPKAGERNGPLKQTVFGIRQGGFLVVDNSKVDASNLYGFTIESSQPIYSRDEHGKENLNMSEAFIENSNIILNGWGARGMYVTSEKSEVKRLPTEAITQLGEFYFKNSTLKVPYGTAFYVDESRRFPYFTVLNGSHIYADRLLEIKNGAYAGLEAHSSFFVGGTRVDQDSFGELELFNKSNWTITQSKRGNRQSQEHLNPSISFVRNIDSSISFKKPQNDDYQTLHIGKKMMSLDYVYITQGNARLIMNANFVAKGGNKEIKTDKVLISGNVYGTTKVHIVDLSKASKNKEEHKQSENKDSYSVSLIQVYGKAKEDSFKLANGYLALRGLPYKYSLRSYGPTSSSGEAKEENRIAGKELIESGEDFWDFRLEADYFSRSSHRSRSQLSNSNNRRTRRSAGSNPSFNQTVADFNVFSPNHAIRIRNIVPQVPTYLLLPNALFHAGMIDINNQNKQLENMRISIEEKSEDTAFFMRGYGGNYRYTPDLSTLKYGYKGNFGYNAAEVGALLDPIESTNYAVTFGIIGAYGKIFLKPQDVAESKKSAFDKLSVTMYGGMRYNTNLYLDSLLSYGSFKGDILNLERGKTATLNGNFLRASLTGGKQFMTGYKGLVFDPQIQVVYQSLLFNKTSDVDGFDVDIGKPDQWMVRIGGRLAKTLATTEDEANFVSLYSKLHVTHGFEKKQLVRLGDPFQIGAFGSSLEAGLGLNARLSPKFVLQADFTYQHKLTKSGFSGTSFSGGLRYRF